MKVTTKAKVLSFLLSLCRIVLALTFVFSGFVKSVDPWGTAIKIGEYIVAFDMEWAYGLRFLVAIWLNGAEMMLGLMVLFKVRLRLTSLFALAAMTFFTGLTLVLAIWNPVEDCGCFGDAIKLTNWETFLKNLVLLPMSAIVFWSARKLPIIPTWKDGGFMLLFGTIAFGIGTYSYFHLPIIDFLPYKIGTDLVDARNRPARREIETVLIYKDLETGKTREFDIRDTTWYDHNRWEYVDTKTKAIRNVVHPSVRDFALFDSRDFVTDQILADPGVVYMIFAADPSDIRPRCREKLTAAVAEASARGYRLLCVTAASLETTPYLDLDGTMIECVNMDATTIKTVLRARSGIVVLKKGVVLDKKNCRDVPSPRSMPHY